MKKDFIFAPILLALGVLLFLLKLTGLTAHIVISIAGIAVLAAYTVLTKKEWKIPALEIAMRAFYAVALITGIIIINASGVAALSVIHKICAAMFVALMAASLVQKLIASKKGS